MGPLPFYVRPVSTTTRVGIVRGTEDPVPHPTSGNLITGYASASPWTATAISDGPWQKGTIGKFENLALEPIQKGEDCGGSISC